MWHPQGCVARCLLKEETGRQDATISTTTTCMTSNPVWEERNHRVSPAHRQTDLSVVAPSGLCRPVLVEGGNGRVERQISTTTNCMTSQYGKERNHRISPAHRQTDLSVVVTSRLGHPVLVEHRLPKSKKGDFDYFKDLEAHIWCVDRSGGTYMCYELILYS